MNEICLEENESTTIVKYQRNSNYHTEKALANYLKNFIGYETIGIVAKEVMKNHKSSTFSIIVSS